jgi:hypothetical protein
MGKNGPLEALERLEELIVRLEQAIKLLQQAPPHQSAEEEKKAIDGFIERWKRSQPQFPEEYE